MKIEGIITPIVTPFYDDEEQNINFTSAYESLNSIISDCAAGNYEAAADKYLQLDRSIITSEPLISQLQEADRLMLNDGFAAISEMGTAQWNGGNLSAAEDVKSQPQRDTQEHQLGGLHRAVVERFHLFDEEACGV